MDFERRKRPFRYLGKIIDVINIILSVVVFVCAAMIVINLEGNMLLFPVIFMCTGLMNLALAIKYFKRRENLKFVMLMLAFFLFMALGVVSMLIVI